MKPLINLIAKSEPLDGPWRYWTCEYSLDNGETWQTGEIEADGHAWAVETLVDEDGNPVKSD